MARRRSQKNKKTTPKENKEVTLEILLSDCSNYVSWSTRVINAFRTIDPQLEQIINIFLMRMIFGLELKVNLMSPNMIVHLMLLLPLVLVKLTL
jgi:hypothetical protein